MLSEKELFAIFDAERNGVLHNISFDDVWADFGYKHFRSAKRYLINSSGLLKYSPAISQRHITRSYRIGDNDSIYLSTDSFKFALARANTDEGADYLDYLIQVEKSYRENLTRNLLQASVATDFGVSDKPAFSYSSKQIQEWVGYCNLSYLRDVIRLDYQEGIDYIEIDKEIYVNADIVQIILSCARPKHGVTIPEELQSRPFPWTKFQAHVFKKTNKRRSCSKSKPTTSPSQMELF